MNYIDYLKKHNAKFLGDMRTNIFASHMWLIHIIQRINEQEKDLFFKLLFEKLNDLRINSLVSTTLIIDLDIRKDIESIYNKVIGGKLVWMNPIVNDTDDINFVFDKYEDSTIEKELIHIISLIIKSKSYMSYKEDNIQFVRNIIEIQRDIVDANDPFNCFQYTRLLTIDTNTLDKDVDNLIKLTDKMEEVETIQGNISTILGNGFTLAISHTNQFKKMAWGGTLNAIKENLKHHYSFHLEIQDYVIQYSKFSDPKIFHAAKKEKRNMVLRQRKYCKGTALLKYMLKVALTIADIRASIYEFLNSNRVNKLSNREEDVEKMEKWLKDKGVIGPNFFLRPLTLFYIMGVDDIEMWRGNLEITMIIIDKLKISGGRWNIHNDIIHSFEKQLYDLWTITKDVKIPQRFSNEINDIFTLNYDSFIEKMDRKCYHLHGSFNQSFRIINEKESIVENTDVFWRNWAKPIENKLHYRYSYSTIFKPADYKLTHIRNVMVDKLDQENLDKSFISNWRKLYQVGDDILIFGSTLKYDLHVLQFLNDKIKTVYIAYYNKTDKLNIMHHIQSHKKMLNKKWTIKLISTKNAIKKLLKE